jgi:hypothetical protein
MGNSKKVYLIFFIITTLIFITSCNKSYLGIYQSTKNNNLYNSKIEIDSSNLSYTASSDMLGTVVQKVPYSIFDNSIIANFNINNTIKSSVNSYFDNKIDGVKISISSVSSNANSPAFSYVIINDSIKYIAQKKDTVFNKFKLKKIELEDRGLEFIKDTVLVFSKKNKDNVFEINLKSKDQLTVLNENGKVKYLINGKKLFVYNYDTLQKKYNKTNRVYLKQ